MRSIVRIANRSCYLGCNLVSRPLLFLFFIAIIFPQLSVRTKKNNSRKSSREIGSSAGIGDAREP